MSVKISGSFWKGTGITRQDILGKELLSYRRPLTGEPSLDFPIAKL